MANTTKELAVSRILGALRPYVIPTSRFGTLGGAGYELAVWERFGVPLANCWLIERDPKRAQRLIARAREAHHFVGRLRDFPSAFRSAHPGGTLDVFHWDLCETVEPNARELRYVFPVIAGSTSRCLLVTAADQRRNRSLDEADVTDAWWAWLLGSAATALAFRAQLEAQGRAAQRRGLTTAEAASAATRELSAYLHLFLVMCDFRFANEVVARGRSMGLAAFDRTRAAAVHKRAIDVGGSFAGGREPLVTFVPDALVRCVYYSRADSAVRPGFRMWTIGMHLARLERPVPLRAAAVELAALVGATPLQMVIPGSRNRVRTVTVSVPRAARGDTPQQEAAMMTARDREDVAAASPLHGNPFERMTHEVDAFATGLAQRLRRLGHDTNAVVTLLGRVRSALGGLESIEALARSAEDAQRAQDRLRNRLATVADADVPTAPSPSPGSPADASAAPTPLQHAGTSSSGMTEAQRDALRMRLLRARAKDDATYRAEKLAIESETGLSRRAVGGLIATTRGKWEATFIRRVCGTAPRGAERRTLIAELRSLGFGSVGVAKKALGSFSR